MEEKSFLVKDLSGRGYVTKMDINDLATMIKEAEDYDGNIDLYELTEEEAEDLEYMFELLHRVETCNIGDEFHISSSIKVTRIL